MTCPDFQLLLLLWHEWEHSPTCGPSVFSELAQVLLRNRRKLGHSLWLEKQQGGRYNFTFSDFSNFVA